MSDTFKIYPWLLAIRPKTLLVGLAPVLVGFSFTLASDDTDKNINYVAAVLCAFVSVFLQISANLANDYFDFKKGVDADDRVGPLRVTTAGLLTPEQVKKGLFVFMGLSMLSGFWLIYQGGWVLAVLAIFALISAVAYTGGPFPLGYNGLGDIFVFIFFGPVAVCATAFLTGGKVPPDSWLGAAGVGMMAVNVLVVNNIRDYEQDKRYNKNTLVVKLGKKQGYWQYALALVLSFVAVVALFGYRRSYFLLLPALIIPVCVKVFLKLLHKKGKELNSVLAQTAALCLVYSLLLSLGLLLSL